MEAYYGDWNIEAFWTGAPVGGLRVSVNEPEVEVHLKCNVGDISVIVVDHYGNLIDVNIVLFNSTYGLSFSGYSDGLKQNATSTQEPLVQYNLMVIGDFEITTYVLDASQTRQIRIEVLTVEKMKVDNTSYCIIGGMIITIVVGTIGYLFFRRRESSIAT